MDLKDRIKRIADELRGKERVTYAAIRKRLKEQTGSGCSNSTLKPVYAEWMSETEYLVKIESDPGLPEAVQKSLIALGHTILREGEERARAKLTEQQRKLDRQAEILLGVDDEIVMAADRMEEEIADLRLEVTRLHEALARAQAGRADPEPGHKPRSPTPPKAAPLDPITAAAADFNEKDARTKDPDVLLADIAARIKELLTEHGPCDASQLHFHLQKEFGKRADAMQMPLETGWLRHWLRGFTGPVGGLIEVKGTFDLASRTADAGAAFQARVMADVHALLQDHGFPMALPAITKRLTPKLGQELRLTGGQLGDWMKARPDLFRKTTKGWFASVPGPV